MQKLNHYVLFLLLVSFSKTSFSQELKFKTLAKYQYTFQQDSTNINSKAHEEMLLLIDENKSLFISNSKFMLDTLKNNNKLNINEILSIKSNIPKNRVKFEIITDKKQKKSQYYEKIFINTYVEDFPTELMTWNLKNEKKQVNGYSCNMAITNFAGRSYVAWFTTEVPVFEGPYKFKGLPGLIVELYDTKKEHYFLLSSLEKKSTTYKLSHRNIIKADMNEIAKVRSNQINNIKNSGFNISKELMQKAKKKLAKINNHIELTQQ